MKFGMKKKTEEAESDFYHTEEAHIEELPFLGSLLLRPNAAGIKDKDKLKDFIGRHIYVFRTDDRRENKQYFRGDILVVRDITGYSYSYGDYSFKVGPLGSLNPGDYNVNVPLEDVFVLPRTREELIEEYNRLVSATEQLAARIDYLEATGKTQFDEKIYLADKTFGDLYTLWGQPEVGKENNLTEKENKIRDFLRKVIKI